MAPYEYKEFPKWVKHPFYGDKIVHTPQEEKQFLAQKPPKNAVPTASDPPVPEPPPGNGEGTPTP